MKKHFNTHSCLLLFAILAVVMIIELIRVHCPADEFATTRLDTAELTPKISGIVTDVRVLANFRGSNPNSDSKIRSYLQIVYGYKEDGAWKNYPAENFPVCGIWNGNDKNTGYEAAYESHIVEIGPYWLVCVTVEPGQAAPYDSLGTKPIQCFCNFAESGILLENPADIRNCNEKAYELKEKMFDRYYFLLEAAELPDDYILYRSVETGDIMESLTLSDFKEILSSSH